MSIRSDEEQNEAFNESLNEHVITLHARLDELRFGTRNPFIDRATINASIDEVNEFGKEVRLFFINTSLSILFEAIEKDAAQFRELAAWPKKKYIFDIYHTEHLEAEKTAQEGYVFRPTIGFLMSDSITAKGEPIGNIMEARFITDESISINEFTDTDKLHDLVSKHDEVYIKYAKVNAANDSHISVFLRISKDGIQLAEPIDEDQSVDHLIDMTSIGDETEYIDVDIDQAEIVVDLISKLSSMKLIKAKTAKS